MNIIFNNKSISVHDPSATILDNIEHSGISLDSQCRSGICGVCKRKLISGQFKYKQSPLAYTLDEEVLICIAIINDNIKIE